jgi:hypothetical protein
VPRGVLKAPTHGVENEMPNFCVNTEAQSNGDHEVHDVSQNKWCLPDASHRRDLGWHSSCTDAVREAKTHYRQSNGCAWCAPACHTS